MSTLAAVIKVSLDQCLMAPVGLACFFISMKVRSGRQCLCSAGHQSLTHFRLSAGPVQVMEGETGGLAAPILDSLSSPSPSPDAGDGGRDWGAGSADP